MIVVREAEPQVRLRDQLRIDAQFVADWLVKFLQDEVIRQRRMTKVVIGLSGGVDSAVVTYLAARAFGPENVFAFRMPYRISSAESLTHAELVIRDLKIQDRIIDITAMVDGYATQFEPGLDATRLGNVCSRCRMTVLFDQAAEVAGLPLGTGNKSERLFGYYTWHGDDAPPINPLGDLFKTQVWALARHLGVPDVIVDKPATADLVKGQTDEGDIGVSYEEADPILALLVAGYRRDQVIAQGFRPAAVHLCFEKVSRTHWKRHLPTVAMLTDTAINEYYLRPVDYTHDRK